MQLCCYCKKSLTHSDPAGTECNIIAVHISCSDLEKYSIPNNSRSFCYDCQWKMLDTLAKLSGCVKDE